MSGKVDWPAELERLAVEAEKEALAKADDIFAQAADEHQRQTRGFAFECRRWGDFLAVFIQRLGNDTSKYWGEKPEKKVVASLNLGKTPIIKLTGGHCFDRRGEVHYDYSLQSDDGGGLVIWDGSYRISPPPKGYQYKVRPSLPYIAPCRPMLRTGSGEKHRGSYGPSPAIRHVTPDYPRPARDDEIHFADIDITIFAPAGMGRGVYDAILAEIETREPA